jgi:hypothetical protein
MKRNIKWLGVGKRLSSWLLPLACVGVGCHPVERTADKPASPTPGLPLERIAIVGARVSAGCGGVSFGDAFTQVAKRSVIESEADVMLFRDPIANQRAQLDRAIAFKATAIVALGSSGVMFRTW